MRRYAPHEVHLLFYKVDPGAVVRLGRLPVDDTFLRR
jgi:hypothetical protein